MILILLAPAFISLLLYEKLTGFKLSVFERIAWSCIYAFLINTGVYTVLWLRGWTEVFWTIDSTQLASVSFCVQYMAMSLLLSVALPFIFSLIKIGKKND